MRKKQACRKNGMLLIPCKRKNRSLERSSKKQRPDKHSQNRPKRTEKQPHQKRRKHPRNPAKKGAERQAKTRPKTKLENLSLACKVSAVVINHPGHRAMSSGDKTDPNGLESPKNKAQKTAETRKPKEKPRKQAKQATKSAKGNKQKQTKKNPPKEETRQDRLLYNRGKIPSCKLPFRLQVHRTEIGAGVKNPLGCCASVGSCDQPPWHCTMSSR